MLPLNFPNTPTDGQQYSAGGKSWQFDASISPIGAWRLIPMFTADADLSAQYAQDAANASRLTVGTVTTVASGVSAGVIIEGAAGAQTISFTLPVGDTGAKGDPGDPGASGREVLLQTGATHIQWQYAGDVVWNDLVAVADIIGLTGPQGAAGANGTNGTNGRGIASVVRTVGTGAPGTTDTYTITFTDTSTTTFQVVHGANGAGSGDISGPASAADNAIALFSGTTGKLLKTTGVKLADLAHPANHPPSIITQDSSNRFVTDAEKATWNAKQPAGTYATGTGTATGTNTGDQDLSGKQNVLVSGTSIKTINSQSLLGSGNITITAGAANITSLAITYNGDGTVATTTEDGVTKTMTYNGDGTINTIAWPVGGGSIRTETYSYTSGVLTGMTAAEA